MGLVDGGPRARYPVWPPDGQSPQTADLARETRPGFRKLGEQPRGDHRVIAFVVDLEAKSVLQVVAGLFVQSATIAARSEISTTQKPSVSGRRAAIARRASTDGGWWACRDDNGAHGKGAAANPS